MKEPSQRRARVPAAPPRNTTRRRRAGVGTPQRYSRAECCASAAASGGRRPWVVLTGAARRALTKFSAIQRLFAPRRRSSTRVCTEVGQGAVSGLGGLAASWLRVLANFSDERRLSAGRPTQTAELSPKLAAVGWAWAAWTWLGWAGMRARRARRRAAPRGGKRPFVPYRSLARPQPASLGPAAG